MLTIHVREKTCAAELAMLATSIDEELVIRGKESDLPLASKNDGIIHLRCFEGDHIVYVCNELVTLAKKHSAFCFKTTFSGVVLAATQSSSADFLYGYFVGRYKED